MALSTYVGSFSMNTSTGNQAITGVGFQPKVILFFANALTADGSGANANEMLGCAISSTERWTGMGISNDAAATAAARDRLDNTKCLTFINTANTVLAAADFVSQDADGFTINVTTADATSRVINYIALGGTDLSNVKAGSFTNPLVVGNAGTTGVGFQPDCLLLFSPRHLDSTLPGGFHHIQWSLGVGTSSSAQWVSSWKTEGNASDPSDTARYQRTASIFAMIDPFTDTKNKEAVLVSLDSDGFTLNWTTIVAEAGQIFYLALKGGQYKVGADTQKTSTGTQATSGIGFTPTGLLLTGFNNIATTSIITSGRNSLGAASSTTQRGHIWIGDLDNQADTVAKSDLDRTAVLKHLTEASGGPTTEADADLDSFNSDDFTLNYGTADATARQFLYLVVGSIPTTVVKDIIGMGVVPFPR